MPADTQSDKQNQPLDERKQRIYDFLKAHPVGVLATVDPDNNPHATVIYYAVDSKFNILFTTKSDTKKSDNLKHNDHAELAVFEAAWQSVVQITGRVTEVTDKFEEELAFSHTVQASMQTSSEGVPPISKLVAGKYVAYKLEPVQIRMAVYARPESGDHESLFDTLEAYEL